MLDMLKDYQAEVHSGIDTVTAEITLYCQKLSLDSELFLSDQKAKSKQYEDLKASNLKLQQIMNLCRAEISIAEASISCFLYL